MLSGIISRTSGRQPASTVERPGPGRHDWPYRSIRPSRVQPANRQRSPGSVLPDLYLGPKCPAPLLPYVCTSPDLNAWSRPQKFPITSCLCFLLSRPQQNYVLIYDGQSSCGTKITGHGDMVLLVTAGNRSGCSALFRPTSSKVRMADLSCCP